MNFYSKALESFYDKCFELINNIFDIDKIKCFIIAGPGTTPENFLNYVKKKSELKEYVFVRKNLSKFIMAKASSS